MADDRKTLKISSEEVQDRYEFLKREGETTDGLLARAFDALETAQPIREIPNAVVYTHSESIGKHEGRVEVHENWVRLVGGAAPAWVPREEIEQIIEE